MLLADKWNDYCLIDASDGQKLEKWGDFYLVRPDPQAIWSHRSEKKLWDIAHAVYHRSKSGGGSWEYRQVLPDAWQINYRNLTFNVKPMGFKHTGIFPEQAANWDFIIDKISNSSRPIKVLNLFAYTGGATVAAASAGASVVHVDAAKGMVSSTVILKTKSVISWKSCFHCFPIYLLRSYGIRCHDLSFLNGEF